MTEPTSLRESENVETAPLSRRLISRTLLCLVLGFVVLLVCLCRRADKPAPRLVLTVDSASELNEVDSAATDYRSYYDSLQEKEVFPLEENGWRLLLETFGPRALEQDRLASSVPWAEFSTNESTKNWYENQWTTICAKMNVDPTVKPQFIDRMTAVDFLMARGAEDSEPPEVYVQTDVVGGIAEDESNFYYREGRRLRGRMARSEASEFFSELSERPWKAEECSALARWIGENADQYDVLARAARRPKFACWHIAPEYPETMTATLLPDVQKTRYFTDVLALRMNLRIGSGRVSEALDDFETQLLIAKSLLRASHACLLEKLFGIAVLRKALYAPLFYRLDAIPTAEERERYFSLVREFTTERFWADAEGGAGESVVIFATVADALRARRDGNGFFEELARGFGEPGTADEIANSNSNLFAKALVRLAPFDDEAFMREFADLWRTAETNRMSRQDIDRYVDDWKARRGGGTTGARASLVAFCAKYGTPDFGFYHGLFCRQLAVCRMAAVGEALLAYQAENGTLPPAFTVDGEGNPLQSWRVLILPYLGEEGKALYSQIRLDEAWDSEHNRQFHKAMPEVFAVAKIGVSGKETPSDGLTQLTTLLGDGLFFDESGEGKDWRALRDREERDALKQALVTERNRSACWMQPEAEVQAEDLNAAVQKMHFTQSAVPVVKRLNDVVKFNPLKERTGAIWFYSVGGGTKETSTSASIEEWNAFIDGNGASTLDRVRNLAPVDSASERREP